MANRSTAPARTRGRQVQKQSHLGRWLIVLAILVVVGGVVALALLTGERGGLVEQFTVTSPGTPLAARDPGAQVPGTSIPDLGRGHVRAGSPVNYNSNPPTSGQHYDTWAQWGIYDGAPADGQLVHNLEHGGIIISYNPDRVSGEELEQLRALTRELAGINPRIILTPRENLDSPVALTAWGYLQKLESVDVEAIKEFYNAHIARGPECSPPGVCPR